MRVEDIFGLSLSGILHRRLRSFLTVLGIMIGIGTVIALISIGQGFQENINGQLAQLGGSTIIITPGHSKAGGGNLFGGGGFGGGGTRSTISTLTENDVHAIRTVTGVQEAMGIVSGGVKIEFNGQNASSSVIGVDPGLWQLIQTVNLESGRYVREGDTGAAVIGSRVAQDLFKKNVTLNNKIVVGGKNFQVVGILQQTGGLVGGFSDNAVIVLKASARNILTSVGSNDVSVILARASETADANQVSTGIEQRMQAAHHVTQQNEDFTVISPETIQSSISAITGAITFFLGAIAGISLLVGSIGIANTMFTSVIERTKQIGLLKALGMTGREVMGLFLMESALMGLIGGLGGAAIGIAVSELLSSVGGGGGGGGLFGGGFKASVSPELILFAVAFSIAIGAISGLIPARRAAKLEPVEALRYE